MSEGGRAGAPPLTEDELVSVRRAHVPGERGQWARPRCDWCRELWPCDAVRLVAVLDAERARVTERDEKIARQAEQLRAKDEKIVHQAAQLTVQRVALEERNRQLDALRWVWCDGGCETGANRYGPGGAAAITEDVVAAAIENTERLVSWFLNHVYRRDRAEYERAKARLPRLPWVSKRIFDRWRRLQRARVAERDRALAELYAATGEFFAAWYADWGDGFIVPAELENGLWALMEHRGWDTARALLKGAGDGNG